MSSVSRDHEPTITAVTSGHTPGPWAVPHFAEPDVNCECGYVLSDGYMGAVCTVHASGEGSDWRNHGDNPKFAEAVANAHLIAAAPELLTALKATLNSLLGLHVCGPSVNLARAAIAKAEGRAPSSAEPEAGEDSRDTK